ncbi:hypothetical protein JL720_16427 [Aureococcus anophagefferens]|nr:hypothetical protein JL720_16427 [Aureococcus anophagefferens]
MASKSIIDLEKCIDKEVRVKFQGGREDPDDPYRLTDKTRKLGLVVCRGLQRHDLRERRRRRRSLLEGMADDPWTTNYESDSVGVSQTSLSLDDFTLDGAYPVAGRAVVIHAADGTRIGCGVLEDAVYASIGPYPGYAMMQSATLGPYPATTATSPWRGP